MNNDTVNVRLTDAGRELAAGGRLSIHGGKSLHFKGDEEQPVHLAVWHEHLKTTHPHGKAIFEIVPTQPATLTTSLKTSKK